MREWMGRAWTVLGGGPSSARRIAALRDSRMAARTADPVACAMGFIVDSIISNRLRIVGQQATWIRDGRRRADKDPAPPPQDLADYVKRLPSDAHIRG